MRIDALRPHVVSPGTGRRRRSVAAALATAGTAAVLVAAPAAALGRGDSTTVEGSATPIGAPTVGPGAWQDEIPGSAPGSRFYRIERRHSGSSLVVTSSIPLAEDSSSYARVGFQKLDGTSCYTVTTTDQSQVTQAATAAAVSGPLNGSGEIDPEAGCADQQQLLIELTGPDGSAAAVPVRLTIVEIPAATDVTSLPVRPETVKWLDPVQGGDGPQVTGGAGRAPGPLLDPGTYRTQFSPGEERRFRVRAGWGQSVSAASTVALPASADDTVGSTTRPEVELTVLGPNGVPATTSVSDGPVRSTSLWAGETEQVGVQTLPVLYRNLGDSSGLGASQPGTFVVAARLTAGEPPLTEPVDVLLHVGVNGEVAGEPTFADGQEIDTGGLDDPTGRGRTLAGIPVAVVASGLAAAGVASLLGGLVLTLRRWRRAPVR